MSHVPSQSPPRRRDSPEPGFGTLPPGAGVRLSPFSGMLGGGAPRT